MRIPIYLVIESEFTDRARITKAVEIALLPKVVQILVSYGNKLQITPSADQVLKAACGSYQIDVIDEVEAMVRKG